MSGERREERHIATLVHGRFLVEAPADPAGCPLLVGFHGYGETADKSLEELRKIPGAAQWVLCAVQGLHPFYNRTGDVIASWMTRQDRELAIADNVRYVASVVAEMQRTTAGSGPVSGRLAFLGFSQGAAMAYRAAAGSGHACHGVVVLGGDVPPELEARDLAAFPPVLLGRGSSEEWYDAAKMEHDVELLRRKSIDVRPLVFTGGHEWTNEFRAAAGTFLREIFSPAS
ncbi:MAG TPA: phospholipase [Thermoanaerobaculia bacterium]|jgi:predicted esterase|nr:phospholipase [Thermoanaerobaculia bacterium]